MNVSEAFALEQAKTQIKILRFQCMLIPDKQIIINKCLRLRTNLLITYPVLSKHFPPLPEKYQR